MSAEPNGTSAWYFVWAAANTALSALLAIFGAVLRWNWTRLVAQVDSKADKELVAERHAEYIGRLEEIIGMIRSSDRVASTERHDVRDRLGALTVTVAVLADRAGLKK